MKALIIGGGGFVGGYLADELNNNGYDVYITCLEKVD
jgi:nucleoside-diphosphate-sugar epimerase